MHQLRQLHRPGAHHHPRQRSSASGNAERADRGTTDRRVSAVAGRPGNRMMTEVDLQALRRGDEAAFLDLVNSYHSVLLRLARVYSPTREAAEEAVQETWIAVLRGLDGFEGRAALRTWICHILVRIARRRSAAETRSVPFSSFADGDDAAAAVDPDRFQRTGPYAGHWVNPLPDWATLPEHALLSQEVQDVVANAIAELPRNQRV